MSSTQENRAMRLYLEQCRDWVFDLYSNHGVRVNQIYRALVHYREPWVDPSKLRSAIARWKENQQPQAWPLQQPQRTSGFVIPPPPDPELYLWPLLGIVGPLPNASHLSLPMAARPAHPDREIPPRTGPSSFMRTSMMGPSMSMSSFPQPETYSRYYTPQQQIDQAQSSSSGTSAPQPTSQAILPVFHENPSPPAKTAEDDSMADADCEPEIGSICEECKEVVGDNCRCYLFGC